MMMRRFIGLKFNKDGKICCIHGFFSLGSPFEAETISTEIASFDIRLVPEGLPKPVKRRRFVMKMESHLSEMKNLTSYAEKKKCLYLI